ncbi:MAG: hypothetical protein HYR88_16740 [Verrucomicrobia bacterium]|nr:hypothetical protein [Verrucomicrobiota bacterium]
MRSGHGVYVFAPEGRRLGAYSSENATLTVFECRGREVCRVLGESIPADRSQVGPWNGGFSPDGRLLVVASYDGLRLYETERGRELAHFSSRGWFAAEFLGESNIYSAGLSGLARWPLSWRGPDDLTVVQAKYEVTGGQWHLRSSDQADLVVSATIDGRFLMLGGQGQRSQIAHGSNLRGVSLSPDGRFVAGWVGAKSRVVVWKTANGEVVREFPADVNNATAFDPAGGRIAMNDHDTVVVWDMASGRELWRRTLPTGGPALAWSPDGRMIAALRDGSIPMLIDASNGALLAHLEHPDSFPYNNLVFDPEGARLACFSTGHRTHLWNLRALRRELAGLDLDWDLPPFPPARLAVTPRVETRTSAPP